MNELSKLDDNCLKRVGKRMPYTMPEGFFNNLEQNILAEVAAEPKETAKPEMTIKRRFRILPLVWNVACAAIVAVCGIYIMGGGNSAECESVEQAFSQLDPSDQLFFIEAMQQDLFINDETY